MTRLPGTVIGVARRPMPDIYAVLLIVGILFLLIGAIVVLQDLLGNYGLRFGELLSGVKLP